LGLREACGCGASQDEQTAPDCFHRHPF
jgi:hypothetical protein